MVSERGLNGECWAIEIAQRVTKTAMRRSYSNVKEFYGNTWRESEMKETKLLGCYYTRSL